MNEDVNSQETVQGADPAGQTVGTESGTNYTEQLNEIINSLQAETTTSQVVLPNGGLLVIENKVTLGDSLVASGIFLLLSFLVLRWLLNLIWYRRG